jgi:hypothetical protein
MSWFGIITKQAIRRGAFTSLRQLINTINTYITNWNHDSNPSPGPQQRMIIATFACFIRTSRNYSPTTLSKIY